MFNLKKYIIMKTQETKKTIDTFDFEEIAVEEMAKLTGGKGGNDGAITEYGELLFPDF
jgi:hypothetical protein